MFTGACFLMLFVFGQFLLVLGFLRLNFCIPLRRWYLLDVQVWVVCELPVLDGLI